MIIGITGAIATRDGKYVGIAGAGKDTVAARLKDRHGFSVVSLADPVKRICQEVFSFSEAQLWGPSEERSKPDERYPRSDGTFLTPRHALQQLGTEWGRGCYENAWVDLALQAARTLMGSSIARYSRTDGVSFFGGQHHLGRPALGVAIPDVRFLNEVQAIKKAGGLVIRVARPATSDKMTDTHSSEQEALSILDSEMDFVIRNEGSLADLFEATDEAYQFLLRYGAVLSKNGNP